MKAFKVVGIKDGVGFEGVFLASGIAAAFNKAIKAGVVRPMFVAL